MERRESDLVAVWRKSRAILHLGPAGEGYDFQSSDAPLFSWE
jgi:hypothetical protein